MQKEDNKTKIDLLHGLDYFNFTGIQPDENFIIEDHLIRFYYQSEKGHKFNPGAIARLFAQNWRAKLHQKIVDAKARLEERKKNNTFILKKV